MTQFKGRSLSSLLASLDQAGHLCQQEGEVTYVNIGHGQHPPRAGIKILIGASTLNVSVMDRDDAKFQRYPGNFEELVSALIKTGHIIETTHITIVVFSKDSLIDEGKINLTISQEGLRLSGTATGAKLVEDLAANEVSVVDLVHRDTSQNRYR